MRLLFISFVLSFVGIQVEAHSCATVTRLTGTSSIIIRPESTYANRIQALKEMVAAVANDPSKADYAYYLVLRIDDPGTSTEFTETLRWAKNEIAHFYGE